MNKTSVWLIGFATLISIQGCAGGYYWEYKQPQGGEIATLMMKIDPNFKGASQSFSISPSQKRSEHKVILPALSTTDWIRRPVTQHSTTIPANRRVYLRASSVYAAGGTQYTAFTNHCVNQVSFVPTSGNHYIALQTTIGKGADCSLIITDVSSGEIPSTAETYTSYD